MIQDELERLLRQIYPAQEQGVLAGQIIDAFWPEGTMRLDARRTAGNEHWSEEDSVMITYGDSLLDGAHKPLDLLYDFLLEHMSGVVNAVHILPFFPFTSDDGFAVSDYEKVNTTLGDWPDIERIASHFHLMSDLVLNHVSSQGKWFSEYRQGWEPYDKFFFEADPEDDLSAVVRPRTTPLLQAVETASGVKHVWCTFSHDQVDLNFKNPKVLTEIIRIIRLHVDKGVRIIRLDAVAFVWKEPGTNSIHLPQTHAIVQLLRLLVDYAKEDIILLTETNVPKAENLSYFGQGNEAHVVYNFPLPPLILHALLSGEAAELQNWQAAMPPAPMGCAYLNFTASHDGIGMRPAEGLLNPAQIDKMIGYIREIDGEVSMRALPDGGEAAYELNCTYFSALKQTFEGADDHHLARFLASQTIVMSLEGIPAFYIHSMLATPNDKEAVSRRQMNRAINRHRWDYPTLKGHLADSETQHAQVLSLLSDRLRLRARQPAFHPNATQFTLRMDPRVFGIWRQSLDRAQSVFALHNVSSDVVEVPLSAMNLIADEDWKDILADEVLVGETVALAPYQCRWITNRI